MGEPKQDSVMNRAAWWALELSKLLARNANLRAQIPADAELLVMPSEDFEVVVHNLGTMLFRPGSKMVLIGIDRQGDTYHVTPYVALEGLKLSAA
jgi:hypothetical protein